MKKRQSHPIPVHGFPSTAWSAILGAQQIDEVEREKAMARLMSIYWRPVYWSLRIDWHIPHEEAKDLTQDYLTMFIEKDLLDPVKRDKGRFRSYIKTTLKHVILNYRRAKDRIKRGGGRRAIDLDGLDETEMQTRVINDLPEKRFERELMRSILKQSLEDLESHCDREGKREHFVLFREFYVDNSTNGTAISYQTLQEQYGLSEHQVKNRLAELRVLYRKTVLGYLRDGLSSEEDLLSEIKEVFGA